MIRWRSDDSRTGQFRPLAARGSDGVKAWPGEGPSVTVTNPSLDGLGDANSRIGPFCGWGECQRGLNVAR